MQFCFKKQCYFYGKKIISIEIPLCSHILKFRKKNNFLKIACFFNGKSRILIDHFLYFVSDSALDTNIIVQMVAS